MARSSTAEAAPVEHASSDDVDGLSDLRPAKRRRTNGTATAHENGSTEKTTANTTSGKRKSVAAESSATVHDAGRQSARRASGRLKAAQNGRKNATNTIGRRKAPTGGRGANQISSTEENADSAYGSKEDSLVEDPAQEGNDEDTIMVEQPAARQPVESEQSAASLEIPETPGNEDVALNGGRRTSRSVRASAQNSNPTKKANNGPADVEDGEGHNGAPSSSTRKAVSSRKTSRVSSAAKATKKQVAPPAEEGTALVIAESDDELQAEGTTPIRVPSARSRRPPRRLSIETSSTREPTPSLAATDRALVDGTASPQPKGILTPAKGRKNAQRKSVLFDHDERQVEEQLGFKDIDQSTKKRRKSARATEAVAYAEADDEDISAAANANAPETEADPLLDFDQPLDLLQSLEQKQSLPPVESHEDTPAIHAIKARVLSQMTSAVPCAPASYLTTQQNTLTNLLRSTVVSGESNSLLMLGPRGAGKTLLLEHVLKELVSEHGSLFHTVRLNGFFQTDDRLALREIWRQLGRETQAPEEGDDNVGPLATTLSYADTLASLLSLLSHPDEMDVEDQDMDTIMADANGPQKTAKSTIIILDEFDLFTLHPRQTLLYNLFDIAQSRKAPIAVIGCSTRMDIVESLEKRVKSRFSHRWLHVPPVKTLAEMNTVVESALTISLTADDTVDKQLDVHEVQRWNQGINTSFLPAPAISHLISQTFHNTKSIPETLAALYAPIATLSVPSPATSNTSKSKPTTTSTPTNTTTYLTITQSPTHLPHQSILDIALTLPFQHLTLLSALLSPSYPSPLPSFHTTFTHYQFLLSRTKLLSSSGRASLARSTGPAAGLRQWGRGVCQGVWENLVKVGILVVAGGSGSGAGGDGAMVDDWQGVRVEVDEEEVLWVLKCRQGGKGGGAEGNGGMGVLMGWIRGDVV